MKNSSKFRMVLAILTFTIPFISCQKEKEFQENGNSTTERVAQIKPAVKEFEIQPSWFKTSNLKSGIIGDIYKNFGIGLDILSNEEKISIFNPGTSVAPLVSTTQEEKTEIAYCATTNYSLIDEAVSSTLAASLKVSTFWVKANASLSISKESRITQSSNSVYVNVLYLKKYGRGTLQYTAPTINNYLTYRTSLNTTESKDGITLDNNQFRKIYGDNFRSAITFGVMLVGTIQIVNVDFSSSYKENIEAQAKIAVRNMVEANASWESEKTSNSCFKNSSIVVTAMAIPRTSAYIFNRDDLVKQINYMDQCYSANDLGVIANEYTKFSNLYPTYNFFNVDEIYYKAKSELMYWDKNNIFKRNQGIALCRIIPMDFDPIIMQPIYFTYLGGGCYYIANNTYRPGYKEFLGYVFKEKIYTNLIPLYAVDSSYLSSYCADNNYNPNNSEQRLLGWVFPK